MAPPKPKDPIDKPKLIVGEGQDELNFLQALTDHLGLTDIAVESYGGKNRLKLYINELLVRPGYQQLATIGITRDTDATVAQDFRGIVGFLTAAGLQGPAGPGLFSVSAPRIGVFLMPDNSQPGTLEHLCLSAIQADPAIPCVAEFMRCLAQTANRQPREMAKAQIRTWLASLDPPDLSLGVAAVKGIWPWDNAVFDPLKQFLRNL